MILSPRYTACRMYRYEYSLSFAELMRCAFLVFGAYAFVFFLPAEGTALRS